MERAGKALSQKGIYKMTKLLDKRGAAELLGVSVRTVDTLRKQRGLPFCFVGGQVRFNELELSEWVKTQQPTAPAGKQEERDQ